MTVASGASIYKGYEYYKAGRVLTAENIGEGIYCGTVAGNGGNQYQVTIDINHAKKSHCNCPHADGRRVICKHMIALFFTLFPQEAEQYWAELEAYWEEEDRLYEREKKELDRFIRSLTKVQLQDMLTEILYNGPEWQYRNFIDSYIGPVD